MFSILKPTLWLAAGLLAPALAIVACGGGSTPAGNVGSGANSLTAGEYLFEGGVSTSDLSYAKIDPTTGKLSSPTFAASQVSNSGSFPGLVVAPSKNFVYAFWSSFSLLETFEMKGPGVQLFSKKSGNYTVNVPDQDSLILHPTGKFLYVVMSNSESSIQEISVDTLTGTLTPGSAQKPLDYGGWATMDPSGKYLYLSGYGRIFAFKIDQTTGALSPVAGSPFALPQNQMPSQLVIGGSGMSLFLYADLSPSSGFLAGIAGFAIDSSTGTLSTIPGSPFQSEDAPGFLCVHPSRGFLYSSSSTSLAGLQINASTGALTQVPGSPYPATAFGALAIDPMGKFLYAANYQSSTIYGFSLDSVTGSFASLPGSPFPSVPQPNNLTPMSIP